METEAGFAVTLRAVELATSLNITDSGDFQAWGPIGVLTANDPDALTVRALYSNGGRNVSKYKSAAMDRLLDQTRAATDPAERQRLFHQVAAQVTEDRPVIYLYHLRALYGLSVKVHNLTTSGDGYALFTDVTVE